MKADTRPPLYGYSENYKKSIPAIPEMPIASKKRNKFSDTDYNSVIDLAERVERAKTDGKHYLNVFSSYPTRLRPLLKQFVAASEVVALSGRCRLHYTLADQATEDLSRLEKMIAGGPIQKYDPENPLIAYNAKGDRVNLTKANNYSNSVYKDDNSGQSFVITNDLAKKAMELQKNQEDVQKASSSINYIFAGIAVIGIIIMIWFVKKNKNN